jgi:hypothetical protein
MRGQAMALNKIMLDAPWGKGSYDKALCSALLGTAFCVGYECFFTLLVTCWLFRLHLPILEGMQWIIDYLIAHAGFYAQPVLQWQL